MMPSTPIVVLGAVSLMALSACASVASVASGASARDGVTSMQPESTSVSSVEVGPARLLDTRVNPTVGVQVAASGDDLIVRFAHPRGPGAVERLDPTSLKTLSQTTEPVDRALVDEQTARVIVDGGRRVVVCWKSGDAERGYRAMAQAFKASDGSPLGAPVAISPANADVTGSLSAATPDGQHVVAAFAAWTKGRSFAAYAVPLEVL